MAALTLQESTIVASITFLLYLIPGSAAKGQAPAAVAPPKNTDTFAVNQSGHNIRVQHGELAKANFEIAGVNLTDYREALDEAASTLGKATTHTSGDASTHLEEACYQSADKNDRTLLIIQRGEVSPSFVLAADRSAWKWNTPCRRSTKVTRQMATASGLRLDLTQEQVIAILGLPTSRSHNERAHSDSVSYELEMRKRASQTSLIHSRREHPEMSEKELEQNYGYYDLSESIHGEFANDSLVELEVGWSATD
jgi:hypothetical protein